MTELELESLTEAAVAIEAPQIYHPRAAVDSRAVWWTLRLRGPEPDSPDWQAWKRLVLVHSAWADRIRVQGEDAALIYDNDFRRIEIAGGRAIVEARA